MGQDRVAIWVTAGPRTVKGRVPPVVSRVVSLVRPGRPEPGLRGTRGLGKLLRRQTWREQATERAETDSNCRGVKLRGKRSLRRWTELWLEVARRHRFKKETGQEEQDLGWTDPRGQSPHNGLRLRCRRRGYGDVCRSSSTELMRGRADQ